MVVTIVVILILAGITLNLIAGPSGVLRKATAARKTSEIARYCEMQDMANAAVQIDMYAEGETYSGLYQYIKKKCEENVERELETEDGVYWLETDGILHFSDTKMNDDGKIVPDAEGNLMIKEIVLSNGDI